MQWEVCMMVSNKFKLSLMWPHAPICMIICLCAENWIISQDIGHNSYLGIISNFELRYTRDLRCAWSSSFCLTSFYLVKNLLIKEYLRDPKSIRLFTFSWNFCNAMRSFRMLLASMYQIVCLKYRQTKIKNVLLVIQPHTALKLINHTIRHHFYQCIPYTPLWIVFLWCFFFLLNSKFIKGKKIHDIFHCFRKMSVILHAKYSIKIIL